MQPHTSHTSLVRDKMATKLVTVLVNDELLIADDVMQLADVRHLPVLDDGGALVGVLSQRDLFHSALVKALGHEERESAGLMRKVTVGQVMTAPVLTTESDVALHEAGQKMLDNRIGCLPVVDSGKLVGMLTESDYVRALCGRERGDEDALDAAPRRSGLFDAEVAALHTLRDELRVQVALGTKEARDRFDVAEGRWHRFERSLESFRERSSESLHAVEEAAARVLEQVRRTYDDIKRKL